MIPTPAQPGRRSGIGAVNYRTGQPAVQCPRRQRRREVARLPEALPAEHPTGAA
jgi:hypothetical protein